MICTYLIEIGKGFGPSFWDTEIQEWLKKTYFTNVLYSSKYWLTLVPNRKLKLIGFPPEKDTIKSIK